MKNFKKILILAFIISMFLPGCSNKPLNPQITAIINKAELDIILADGDGPEFYSKKKKTKKKG